MRDRAEELERVAAALRSAGAALPVPDEVQRWAQLSTRLDGRSEAARVAGRERTPMRRRALAALLAACLSLTAFTGVALAATPGSRLYPVRRGLERMALAVVPGAAVEVRVAQARLDDMLVVLDEGRYALASGAARSLVDARAGAAAAGGDVAELDARIRAEVPSALAGAPPTVQRHVRAILGDLIPPAPGAPSLSGDMAQDRSGDGPRGGDERAGDDEPVGGGRPEDQDAGSGAGASSGGGGGTTAGGGPGREEGRDDEDDAEHDDDDEDLDEDDDGEADDDQDEDDEDGDD